MSRHWQQPIDHSRGWRSSPGTWVRTGSLRLLNITQALKAAFRRHSRFTAQAGSRYTPPAGGCTAAAARPLRTEGMQQGQGRAPAGLTSLLNAWPAQSSGQEPLLLEGQRP